MDLTKVFSLSFSLFLLMDPLGNLPVYISCLRHVPLEEQRKVIVRELLIALFVIILFSLIGESLLRILHIGHQALKISGGIILFLIALRMIFSQQQNTYIDATEGGHPFIFPLAVPLVAGPSVLAAVIIYASQKQTLQLITAICIAWGLTTIILLSSPYIHRIFGRRGTLACEKLMGLLITMIATQMFLEGLQQYFSIEQSLLK